MQERIFSTLLKIKKRYISYQNEKARIEFKYE